MAEDNSLSPVSGNGHMEVVVKPKMPLPNSVKSIKDLSILYLGENGKEILETVFANYTMSSYTVYPFTPPAELMYKRLVGIDDAQKINMIISAASERTVSQLLLLDLFQNVPHFVITPEYELQEVSILDVLKVQPSYGDDLRLAKKTIAENVDMFAAFATMKTKILEAINITGDDAVDKKNQEAYKLALVAFKKTVKDTTPQTIEFLKFLDNLLVLARLQQEIPEGLCDMVQMPTVSAKPIVRDITRYKIVDELKLKSGLDENVFNGLMEVYSHNPDSALFKNELPIGKLLTLELAEIKDNLKKLDDDVKTPLAPEAPALTATVKNVVAIMSAENWTKNVVMEPLKIMAPPAENLDKEKKASAELAAKAAAVARLPTKFLQRYLAGGESVVKLSKKEVAAYDQTILPLLGDIAHKYGKDTMERRRELLAFVVANMSNASLLGFVKKIDAKCHDEAKKSDTYILTEAQKDFLTNLASKTVSDAEELAKTNANMYANVLTQLVEVKTRRPQEWTNVNTVTPLALPAPPVPVELPILTAIQEHVKKLRTVPAPAVEVVPVAEPAPNQAFVDALSQVKLQHNYMKTISSIIEKFPNPFSEEQATAANAFLKSHIQYIDGLVARQQAESVRSSITALGATAITATGQQETMSKLDAYCVAMQSAYRADASEQDKFNVEEAKKTLASNIPSVTGSIPSLNQEYTLYTICKMYLDMLHVIHGLELKTNDILLKAFADAVFSTTPDTDLDFMQNTFYGFLLQWLKALPEKEREEVIEKNTLAAAMDLDASTGKNLFTVENAKVMVKVVHNRWVTNNEDIRLHLEKVKNSTQEIQRDLQVHAVELRQGKIDNMGRNIDALKARIKADVSAAVFIPSEINIEIESTRDGLLDACDYLLKALAEVQTTHIANGIADILAKQKEDDVIFDTVVKPLDQDLYSFIAAEEEKADKQDDTHTLDIKLPEFQEVIDEIAKQSQVIRNAIYLEARKSKMDDVLNARIDDLQQLIASIKNKKSLLELKSEVDAILINPAIDLFDLMDIIEKVKDNSELALLYDNEPAAKLAEKRDAVVLKELDKLNVQYDREELDESSALAVATELERLISADTTIVENEIFKALEAKVEAVPVGLCPPDLQRANSVASTNSFVSARSNVSIASINDAFDKDDMAALETVDTIQDAARIAVLAVNKLVCAYRLESLETFMEANIPLPTKINKWQKFMKAALKRRLERIKELAPAPLPAPLGNAAAGENALPAPLGNAAATDLPVGEAPLGNAVENALAALPPEGRNRIPQAGGAWKWWPSKAAPAPVGATPASMMPRVETLLKYLRSDKVRVYDGEDFPLPKFVGTSPLEQMQVFGLLIDLCEQFGGTNITAWEVPSTHATLYADIDHNIRMLNLYLKSFLGQYMVPRSWMAPNTSLKGGRRKKGGARLSNVPWNDMHNAIKDLSEGQTILDALRPVIFNDEPISSATLSPILRFLATLQFNLPDEFKSLTGFFSSKLVYLLKNLETDLLGPIGINNEEDILRNAFLGEMRWFMYFLPNYKNALGAYILSINGILERVSKYVAKLEVPDGQKELSLANSGENKALDDVRFIFNGIVASEEFEKKRKLLRSTRNVFEFQKELSDDGNQRYVQDALKWFFALPALQDAVTKLRNNGCRQITIGDEGGYMMQYNAENMANLGGGLKTWFKGAVSDKFVKWREDRQEKAAIETAAEKIFYRDNELFKDALSSVPAEKITLGRDVNNLEDAIQRMVEMSPMARELFDGVAILTTPLLQAGAAKRLGNEIQKQIDARAKASINKLASAPELSKELEEAEPVGERRPEPEGEPKGEPKGERIPEREGEPGGEREMPAVKKPPKELGNSPMDRYGSQEPQQMVYPSKVPVGKDIPVATNYVPPTTMGVATTVLGMPATVISGGQSMDVGFNVGRKQATEKRIVSHLQMLADFAQALDKKKDAWLKDIAAIGATHNGLASRGAGPADNTLKAEVRRYYNKFLNGMSNKSYNYYAFIRNFYTKEARSQMKAVKVYMNTYSKLLAPNYKDPYRTMGDLVKIIDAETANYQALLKEFNGLNQRLGAINTTYYLELAKLLSASTGEVTLAKLDDDIAVGFKAKMETLANNMVKYPEKLKSYYDVNYSMAELLFDAQFLTLYVIKAIRIGFTYLALFLTTRVFSPMYEEAVFDKKENPPSLLKFLLIFLGFDLSFNVFILVVLFLLKFLFKSDDNAFMIDNYLFQKYVLDYGISMTVLLAIAAIVSAIITDKKYFKYKYEGMRAIRAFQDVVFYMACVLFMFPFFWVL